MSRLTSENKISQNLIYYCPNKNVSCFKWPCFHITLTLFNSSSCKVASFPKICLTSKVNSNRLQLMVFLPIYFFFFNLMVIVLQERFQLTADFLLRSLNCFQSQRSDLTGIEEWERTKTQRKKRMLNKHLRRALTILNFSFKCFILFFGFTWCR